MSTSENQERLPRSWTTTTLENVIIKISNGTTAKQNKEGIGVPVTRIETISHSIVDLERVGYIDKASDELIDKFRLVPGDILFSHINSDTHLGKTALFDFENITILHGMNLLLIRPSKDCVFSKFLNYFFQWLRYSGKFVSIAQHAVNQSSINQKKLKNLSVMLPPLHEQHRMVTKIEELFTRLDAGVEALKHVQTQLKFYRQSVLKSAVEGRLTAEWREKHKNELEPADRLLERILKERREKWEAEQLAQYKAKGKKPPKNWQSKYKEPIPPDTTDLPEVPEGWVYTTIESISDIIHYGYTASSTNEVLGPKMLRITDIQNGRVNWENVPYCKIDGEIIDKFLLKAGDLVFARTGATVGKSYLIKDDVPQSVFASYLIRIILNRIINKEYVYSFFQSSQYWVQIIRGKLGIGQPNVNATTLSKLSIPLPPIAEQNEIQEEIERLFSITDEVQESLASESKRSHSLRQSILKRAFEGKLVPQNPNDEPASALLERIKAEKVNSNKLKQARSL